MTVPEADRSPVLPVNRTVTVGAGIIGMAHDITEVTWLSARRATLLNQLYLLYEDKYACGCWESRHPRPDRHDRVGGCQPGRGPAHRVVRTRESGCSGPPGRRPRRARRLPA